jgi:hypothetical protein
MSIEKLDFNYIKQAHKPFTTFLNDVLQNIKDPLVLGVYVYLSSLPPLWSVNKAHLMDHFKVGRDKIGHVLKFLNDAQLLSYDRERDDRGMLGKVSIIILDGVEFSKNLPKNSTLLSSSAVEQSTLLKIQTMDNPGSGETAPINNIYIKNKTKKNKTCASNDALDGFIEFKTIYPVRKNMQRAQEAWVKKKCYKHKDVIIKHVRDSAQKDADWKKGIIPHPTTYLNGARWEDEIKTQEAQGFKAFHKTNELHSTVPEFVPDYTPINREAGMKGMEMIRKTLGIKSDAKARLNAPALSVGEIYGGGKG